MGKYIKLDLVEAEQFDPAKPPKDVESYRNGDLIGYLIRHPDGTVMYVHQGDWIVRKPWWLEILSDEEFKEHYRLFDFLDDEIDVVVPPIEKSTLCLCPKTCDCENPDGGMLSNYCPEHNLKPLVSDTCKATTHWWQIDA